MKFISYAQNFEDVMLWRALGRFGPGFYLDIGACDPEVDSVTKAFYERGWRGVNIEPMKSAFDRIQSARPLDVNLNCAIAEDSGRKEIYSVDDGNGLSTFSYELAQKYHSEGRAVEKTVIDVTTLAQICDSYANGDILFLKVDVEGGEEAVLRSANFKKYRPWVVLVEATIPNTTISSYDNWDHILVDAKYSFVYFDGLNRFYVAVEKLSLLNEYFQSPPNVFDNFIRNDHQKAMEERKEKVEILNRIEAMLLGDEAQGESIDSKIQHIEKKYVAAIMKISKFDEVTAELDRARAEILYCHQELFESSRVIGALSKERNNLGNQLRELNHLREFAKNAQLEIHEKEDRIASLLGSTSWKATAPLRGLARFFKR